MQPARGFGISDGFLHGDGEGDHIVANFSFDFIDARDVYPSALAQRGRSLARDDSGIGESFAGSQLDFQPLLKAIFVAPYAGHFWAGVTRDQGWLLRHLHVSKNHQRTNSHMECNKRRGKFPALSYPNLRGCVKREDGSLWLHTNAFVS